MWLSQLSPRLHVSMVPDVLPCRGTQFTDICSFVESKLANGESGYVTPLNYKSDNQLQFMYI